MAGFRARSFPDEDGERRGGVVVRRDLAADRDRPVDDIPRRGVELHRELREVAAKDLPTLGVEYLEEVQEPGLRYVKPVGIVGGVGHHVFIALEVDIIEAVLADYIKRRIAAGGLQSIWWLRSLMNPLKYPVASFLFVSHRVLRWSVTPFAMLALIPLNVALILMGCGTVYTVIGVLQALFYAAAAMGWLLDKIGRKSKLLYVPYYFMFMNVNVFRGISYLTTHHTSGTWEKAKRG